MRLAAAFTGALAAGFFCAAVPAAAGHRPVPCSAPDSIVRLAVKLPHTARAIREGREVVIVAIGSSSTLGIGASDAAHSYPAVLGAELRRLWPRLTVRVVNKGVGGETLDQMMARFERDVLAHRPHLVIWQMGSNSVIKNRHVDDYADLVRVGVTQLKAARADIVLMDPQYAPRVIARPVHKRIVETIGAVATDLKVAVFHRFELMHHWVASGQHKIEDLVAQDRLHMNDVSYGCIGRLLAGALDSAARATPAEALTADRAAPAPKAGTAAGR